MKISSRVSVAFLPAALFVTMSLPSPAQTAKTPTPAAPSHAKPPAQTDAERGERAFNANCSRCHQAPETLNPRITGTVVRHMRVRANLSAADERAILHFLNP